MKPRLARGCRINGSELLVPEGILRLQGSAMEILLLCDGKRTLEEIVAQLNQRFNNPRVRDETLAFIRRLVERRALDLV